MKTSRRRTSSSGFKGGFTLVEMITVVVIVAILAAIAVPSYYGYIQSGKRTNRMNIARTIYLAAQNRLTEMRILRQLDDSAIVKAASKNPDDSDNPDGKVYDAGKVTNLSTLDDAKAENNRDNVYYISKAKGDTSGALYELLDPMIADKEVLGDAILLEFNIKTGNVLSVFYGDALNDGEAFYYGAAGVNEARNVTGTRGYELAVANERRQGYYGVDYTGVLLEKELPTVVRLFDGYDKPLMEGSIEYENVLYAEILVPSGTLNNPGNYKLLIKNQNNDTVFESKDVNLRGLTVDETLDDKLTSADLLYKNNTGADTGYTRFVWVLDYVGGDMFEDTPVVLGKYKSHSIGLKPDVSIDPLNPEFNLATLKGNIRVGITDENDVTIVSNYANPYFVSEAAYFNDSYKVATPRHLYNVRYNLSGNFTQTKDINLAAVTNFEPIGSCNRITTITGEYDHTACASLHFTGTYNAGRKNDDDNLITGNLIINNPNTSTLKDIGLFGYVDGKQRVNWDSGKFEQASLNRVTLVNPQVDGGDAENVGTIVGFNAGFISETQVAYTEASFSGSPGSITDVFQVKGTKNLGGMAGKNDGFLNDVTFISPCELTHLDGTTGNTTGGIVGENIGKIKRAFYLAAAPQFDDFIYTKISGDDVTEARFHPIVGALGSAVDDVSGVYYLSGDAKYLNGDSVEITSKEFNVGPANKVGEPFGTEMIYDEYAKAEDNNRGGWTLSFGDGNVKLTKDQTLSEPGTNPFPYPFRAKSALLAGADALRTWKGIETWPVVSHIERPTQVNRTSWEPSEAEDAKRRASNLNFQNGYFTSPSLGTAQFRITPMGELGGWLTRPTDPSNNSNPRAYFIELQSPRIKSGYNGFAYTDYKGGDSQYAELNANLEGTLYQQLATVPLTQQYYSFYHFSRETQNEGDEMEFYLSGYEKQGNGDIWYVDYKTRVASASNAPTLIRPCITPRGTDGGLFGRSREFIDYSKRSKIKGPINIPYYDIVQGYLYDVWVYDSEKNQYYGITFSSGEPGTGSAFNPATFFEDRDVFAGGEEKLNNPKDPPNTEPINTRTLLGMIKNGTIEAKIIGYWDVSYQWKRYYGTYTVPEEQTQTEFAYRSTGGSGKTGSVSVGNYLADCRFETVSFISVDKSFTAIDRESSNYVPPNTELDVTLTLVNWGEATAKEVVLSDSFDPYIAYFKYKDDDYNNPTKLIVTNKTTGAITEVKPDLITKDYDYKNPDNTIETRKVVTGIKLKLPDIRGIEQRKFEGHNFGTTKQQGDTYQVKFTLHVFDYVNEYKGNGKDSTLNFYILNQADVTYKDSGYVAFEKPLGNSSAREQVYVDYISLDSSVGWTPANAYENTNGLEPTEFSVKQYCWGAIPNKVYARGPLFIFVPKGFKVEGDIYGWVYDYNTPDPLPTREKLTYTTSTDLYGVTRIVIDELKAHPAKDIGKPAVEYVLKYTGKGYGVSGAFLESRYEYKAFNTVDIGTEGFVTNTMKFQQSYFGLKAKTEEDNYTVVVGDAVQNVTLYPLANDYLKADDMITQGVDKYEYNSYDVKAVDSAGNESARTDFIKNPNNSFQYKIGTGSEKVSNLFYKIFLTASHKGGIEALDFNLNSRPTQIKMQVNTINVVKTVTAVENRDIADDAEKDVTGNPLPLFNVKFNAWGDVVDYNNMPVTGLYGAYSHVIPHGFELTPESKLKLETDPRYKDRVTVNVVDEIEDVFPYKLISRITTVAVSNVAIGSNATPETDVIEYQIKYTGEKYGVMDSGLATFTCTTPDIVSGLNVMPVNMVGVKARTVNVTTEVTAIVGAEAVTPVAVTDNDMLDVATYRFLEDAGYTLTRKLLLTKEKGIDAVEEGDTFTGDNYEAVIQPDGKIRFKATTNATSFNLYYVVQFTATKSGSPTLISQSRPTLVTVERR